MTPVEMRLAVRAALDARVADCRVKANAAQEKKWVAEMRIFDAENQGERLAGALAQVGFDPGSLSGMAVYAAMKIRRLAAAMAGVGPADPYTETLVKNAVAATPGQVVPNSQMTASLNSRRPTPYALPVRRMGADGTASTQACSSRAALVAIGAGEKVGKTGFKINQDHPAVKSILGVT